MKMKFQKRGIPRKKTAYRRVKRGNHSRPVNAGALSPRGGFRF